jgi:hypothetical protein
MANRIFFILMALSSALALLRGFALAGVLTVDSFGRYAMLFAIGTFGASLLSFGMIERSYKRFPRLCADGHLATALVEADKIVVKLGIRALIVAISCWAVLSLAGRSEWQLASIIAVAVAFSAAVQSAYVSLQRADGALTAIGIASFGRAAITLVFGACGAFLLGWNGALLGEISGGLLGGWISRFYIKANIGSDRILAENGIGDASIALEQKELWTFAGFLGAAIPLYLDRTFVTMLLGHKATGTYALLMLFVMGIYTATAIVSQKVGPELVRMQQRGVSGALQLRALSKWCVGLSAFGVTGMLMVGWVLIDGPMQSYAARYDLEWTLLFAAALLAALQISHLLEWMLLAHDAERSVFIATTVLLLSLAAAIMVAFQAQVDLVALVWLFASAKLTQLISLVILTLLAVRRTHPVHN